MSYIPRLKKEYNDRIVSNLKETFSYKSVMQVPKLEKIVLSRGVGAAVADKKLIDHAVDELTMITGQKAVSTLSKKDVASFKLRKGMPIGAKVTLRGERMYEFLDRLVTTALPRVRDFQGVKATSTFCPLATLGAPQTIGTISSFPKLTSVFFSRSAFGCCSQERTSPTKTPFSPPLILSK